MAKSIPAIITPEVLKWARNLDGITIEEIAHKLKVDAAKIEAWEAGREYPTLRQAKLLAKQYRVPFAYFYLPDVPKKEKRLEKIDCRTFHNLELTGMSRELKWFLRDIEDRRDTMIALYDEIKKEPAVFTLSLPVNIDKESFADRIRDLLSLTQDVQIKFRKPKNALSYCISQLEEKDFLIFQAAKIQPEELRGLSVAYETFPIIALNRKDEYGARLFTLLHELVHILTRTSAICNDMSLDKVQTEEKELFCNQIAGLALVPTSQLKSNRNIPLIRQKGLNDAYVNALAMDFAVSREVILHRLWDIGLIGKSGYFDTLRRYSDEYLEYRKEQKREGFITPAYDKGTQVGKLYVKAVMSAYHADKISPREVSNFLLGLKIKHFEAVERWCY